MRLPHFPSRCATLDVPGMGSITGLRLSSQAKRNLARGGTFGLGDLVQSASLPGQLAITS